MVNDTVVGVLGVFLVIGSMAAVLQTQGAGPSGEDVNDPVGPPPLLGQDAWNAEGCTFALLGWQVDPALLEEHAAPWSPTGLFVLFAYDCSTSVVSGMDDGATRGGGALIEIDRPQDPRNVSAGAWYAQPEAFVPAGKDLATALADHGFATTDAQVQVSTTDLLLGERVQVTLQTDDGSVDANMVLSGSGSQASSRLGILAPTEDTFAVLNGTQAGTERSAQTATVTASGTTWVSRLGLATTPDVALLQQEASWTFNLADQPATPAG